MKKLYLSAVASVALTLFVATFTFPALAQDQESTANSRATRQPPSPDKVVEMLGAKLNLTDDQKSKIKPIIEERQQKIADLRADESMRPMQKRRKVRSIFEDSDKKIEKVLNSDQKKQYAELKEQMREQAQARRHNGGLSNPQ